MFYQSSEYYFYHKLLVTVKQHNSSHIFPLKGVGTFTLYRQKTVPTFKENGGEISAEVYMNQE